MDKSNLEIVLILISIALVCLIWLLIKKKTKKINAMENSNSNF